MAKRLRGDLRYLGPSGFVDDPVSHFRVAMLTVAIALSVVFLSLLLTVQPIRHIIKIPLLSLPESQPRAEWRRVFVNEDSGVSVDGVRCADQLDLRMAIDHLMQRDPVQNIRLSVAPEARHEYFIEILAVLRSSNVTGPYLDTEPLPESEVRYVRPIGERREPYRPRSFAVSSTNAMILPASIPVMTPAPGGCAAQYEFSQ